MRVPRKLANLYPPFLGAGVRVSSDPEFRRIRAEIKLRWWNRNYVGTHFGGSMYTMTDPFYMVMLVERLGRGYRVWLKEATIRFRKPGRGTIAAEFELSDEEVERIRAAADRDGRHEQPLRVEVRDEAGDVVAEIDQLLHVRRRGDDDR